MANQRPQSLDSDLATKTEKVSNQWVDTTKLEHALIRLLEKRSRLRVVQVGANDGVVNDPLVRFVSTHLRSLLCMFIEPHSRPFEELRRRYAAVRHFAFVNGAVGTAGTMPLYTVTAEAWHLIDAPYAKGWPVYRAATGITSSDRSHVYRWLQHFYHGDQPIDSLIECLEVPSAPLASLLRDHAWDGFDVLQVDAEGSDDQVLKHCSLNTYRPVIIHFEHKHLPASRYLECGTWLASLGYQCSRLRENTLAVLSTHCR